MIKTALFFTVAVAAFYVAVTAQGNLPVTQACLGCICEANSGCNTTVGCTGNICGPFGITWAYWSDSGKPTRNNEDPASPTAYSDCANDPYCGALSVQGYMNKFGNQDCNGDGKIDCDDYVAIHKLGGYGCTSQLPDWYYNRYQQCKKIVGNLQQG